MKLIKLFIITWAFSVQAGLPPTTLSGDQQTLKPTTFTALTPNNQATQVLGVQSRIETGNTNLLANPSFEHITITTGWTITNATGTVNTTEMVDGKKDLSLALSGAIAVTQDSTINAANLVGLQGVASIKIKSSDVTGLQVCPRNAGVTVTALCANVVADGTWKNVNIPFIMTATSNGIAIISSGTTGTVKIDDAFVGTSAPFQNVSGAKLVGTLTTTGCIGGWTTTSATFADFGFQSSCTYVTTGAALAPPTQIPSIKFASLPAGDYRLEYEGLLGSSGTGNNASFQFWDGTNTARETSVFNGTSAGTNQAPGISQTISYSTTQSNVTLSIRGKQSGTSTATIYGTTTNPGVIKVWYFPPESKIYSQASLDYDWTAYTPTSPNGSFNTLSATSCYHKRKGSDLFVDCKFTASACSATEAQLSLPTGITANSSIFPSIKNVGTYAQVSADTGGSQMVLLEPSVSYLTFGYNAAGSLTKRIATNLGSCGTFSVKAGPIPISGWSDYGVIVGSFAGIEKCANDYECTDTFSAQVSSTGVVSNENLDWINGNCTVGGTSVYTCPFNTNLKDGTSGLSSTLNCVADPVFSGGQLATIQSASTTNVVVEQRVSTDASLRAAPFNIKCQKGSSDYKPKTAKVASSIGVPTVPGITTQAIDTFSVSYGTTNATTICSVSPCSYLDQIGTAVSSITRSSVGTYSLNTIKTYAKLKCSQPTQGGVSTYVIASNLQCLNCNALTFLSQTRAAGAAEDTFGTISCMGSY
jgi:hypothetical protein